MTLSIAIQNDGVTSKEEVIQSSSYPALIRLGMTGPESIPFGTSGPASEWCLR